MPVPVPTQIYRLTHVDNLGTLLRRGGLHAPHHTPNDGLGYRTIHDVEIQAERRVWVIECGPGGTVHDYVAFYLGPRSPMLYKLNRGGVPGYTEGQEPLIYLVSTVQAVAAAGLDFVFSDGHGIARFTSWYSKLADLDRVDWETVYARYWADTIDDMDRKRRKQAEFLVYRHCPWALIREIGVVSSRTKRQVEGVLARYGQDMLRPVKVRREWYY